MGGAAADRLDELRNVTVQPADVGFWPGEPEDVTPR